METDFASLFLLRPDVVMLNHGSFGACPRPVFETYQAWQLELERQPVEFLGRRFDPLLATARAALAAYLHAEADDLVYVPNATTGLNIVARSLPLQPGDEVLSTDHEYGALDRTWRFVCAKRGASYINLTLPFPLADPQAVVETLWARVTPRTRVLFVSHITSPTALILPLAELIRRARAAGILTVVDGAHAPGQVPLDLTALGADFYSGNCHKWMLAPKGSAFLYARREVQPLLEPLVVSWGWQSEKPGPSRFIDEQQWQGTRDVAAYLSVPAAIEFMQQHDWDRVRAVCQDLACEAKTRLTQLTGQPPLSTDLGASAGRPDSPALRDSGHHWYGQMVSVPLPPVEAETLKARLYDEYRIEVPLFMWNGKPLLRVSVQAYNTRADIDRLLHALRELL